MLHKKKFVRGDCDVIAHTTIPIQNFKEMRLQQDCTGLEDFAMELFTSPATEKPIYYTQLSSSAERMPACVVAPGKERNFSGEEAAVHPDSGRMRNNSGRLYNRKSEKILIGLSLFRMFRINEEQTDRPRMLPAELQCKEHARMCRLTNKGELVWQKNIICLPFRQRSYAEQLG
jgi:hypothetical protein